MPVSGGPRNVEAILPVRSHYGPVCDPKGSVPRTTLAGLSGRPQIEVVSLQFHGETTLANASHCPLCHCGKSSHGGAQTPPKTNSKSEILDPRPKLRLGTHFPKLCFASHTKLTPEPCSQTEFGNKKETFPKELNWWKKPTSFPDSSDTYMRWQANAEDEGSGVGSQLRSNWHVRLTVRLIG